MRRRLTFFLLGFSFGYFVLGQGYLINPYWYAPRGASDTIESYQSGALVNDLDGGVGWLDGYADRKNSFGIITEDTMESYSNGVVVDGLNGGFEWSGRYADKDNNTGIWGLDNMETYTDASAVNGLNGNTSMSNGRSFSFATAYTSN